MSAVVLAVLAAATVAVVLGVDALLVRETPTARIPGLRRGRHTRRAVAARRIHVHLGQQHTALPYVAHTQTWRTP